MTERRRRPRIRKRLGCEIRCGERNYYGIALNVSAQGLFIQTAARIPPDATLELTLGDPRRGLAFVLRGRPARIFVVPTQLAAIAHGGVGIALIDPPEAYLRFVSALLEGGSRSAPAPTVEAAGAFEFRVEMETLTGSESRTLLVSCRSEAEASALALAELDEGWKVISARRL